MKHYGPSISIAAPVYNEAGNIRPFLVEIEQALSNYPKDWEVVLANDGSSDGTADELDAAAKEFSFLHVVHLKRNFGQTAALQAAIDASRGDIIVTMDSDRQNDPADIPAMIELLGQGYDVVSGWRYRRQDDFATRTLPSMMANRLISLFTGVKLHDYGCALKVYTADTLRCFRIYGEMHRFLPALCTWRGAKVVEAKVNHRPRQVGNSKYGLNRTFRVLLDLVTVKFLLEYSTKPMRVFGGTGILSGGAGFAICLYLTAHKFITGTDIGHRPLLFLGVLLIVVGLQLVMLGLVSEILVRIYYECQGKTVYHIDSRRTHERHAPHPH